MAQTITQDDLGQDTSNQQNQQNQGGPQQAGQSGATPSPGASGNGAGANGGYQQQTGQPQQQSTIQSYNPNKQQGSGYTNIQKVLSANQGNKLGQAVGGGIAGQTAQTQGNLNNAQSQFQQDTAANQANTGQNAQLVQNVLGNTADYAQGGANAQQGQQFQQLMSGKYAGPTQLNNQQQIQNQAADVNQLGQATGSQAGQMGLLQRFVGNPQYNQGQQNLDQLLLGQTGQPQLAAARRGALQLQGQVGNALNSAQTVAQQQAGQAQQFGQGVQNQFGQTVSGINTGLQQQAQTLQQGANQKYQKAITDLQSGTVTPDEANLLGLSNGQQVAGNVLQNANQYLTQNANQATAQNVANAKNYAQIDALRQLGSGSAPASAQNILQKYAGQDQNANQFQNQQQITGNQAGFNSTNQGLINNYNNTVNPAQQQYQSAQDILRLETIRNTNSPFSAAGQAAENQLQQQYGGSQGGTSGQQTGWAFNNIQNTQGAYNAALAAANAATGGLRNITITPQQAALQQIAQGSS